MISKYAPVPGYGSNPRWFELAKRFAKSGVQCEIITSDSNHGSSYRVTEGKISMIQIENVTYSILKTLKYEKTASLARVLSWLDFDLRLFQFKRNITPDVIVISSLSLTSILFGIYIKLAKKARLVFEVRDIWPLTMIEEGNFSCLNPLYLFLRGVELLGYKYADLIVGTMPNLRQHVYDSGIKKPRSAFHSCGIGVASERAESTAKYKFTKDVENLIKGKVIIGYCGSIGLTNNLTDFAGYMKNSSHKNAVFLIAGDGAQKEFLTTQLKSQKNVIFLGKIKPELVQGFLRRCDILFLATISSRVWKYGQSMNKVVDYMLAGKFIIAQYDGYPSMINESGCGIFTDREGLASCFDDALKMTSEARNVKGESGRSWLLQNHNYNLLASTYISKIRRTSNI